MALHNIDDTPSLPNSVQAVTEFTNYLKEEKLELSNCSSEDWSLLFGTHLPTPYIYGYPYSNECFEKSNSLSPLVSPALPSIDLPDGPTSMQPSRIIIPNGWKSNLHLNTLSLLRTSKTVSPSPESCSRFSTPLPASTIEHSDDLVLSPGPLYPPECLISPITHSDNDIPASPRSSPALSHISSPFSGSDLLSPLAFTETFINEGEALSYNPITDLNAVLHHSSLTRVSYPTPPPSQTAVTASLLDTAVVEAVDDVGGALTPVAATGDDSDSDFQPRGTRTRRRGPTLRRSTRGRQKYSGPPPSVSVAPKSRQHHSTSLIASKRPDYSGTHPSESLKRTKRKNGRLIGEFPCPGCPKCDQLAVPKTFTRESDLARHLEKMRYVCSRCHESVSRLDALRRHERTCLKHNVD